MKQFVSLLAALLVATAAFAEFEAQKEVQATCDEMVTIMAQPKHGYDFLGWDDNGDGVPDGNTLLTRQVYVNGNASYTAYFTKHNYKIQFVDWNGNILKDSVWAYGDVPTLGYDPYRPATAQYTFTFCCWSPNIVPANGDAIYTAQYDTTINKYTVTFVNWDGTPIESGVLPYGTTITAPTTNPSKPSTDEYDYTFVGYTDEYGNILAPGTTVTGDVTYTAQYTSGAAAHKIYAAVDPSGVADAYVKNAVGTITSDYKYGDKATFSFDNVNGCWRFKGWYIGDVQVSTDAVYEMTVTTNVTVTAKFEKIYFTITVKSADENQGLVDAVK